MAAREGAEPSGPDRACQRPRRAVLRMGQALRDGPAGNSDKLLKMHGFLKLPGHRVLGRSPLRGLRFLPSSHSSPVQPRRRARPIAPSPHQPRPVSRRTTPSSTPSSERFRADALRAGIKPSIYDRSMRGIARNAHIQELNNKQPEFAKPVWDYLDSAVSDTRVQNGRDKLAANATMLAISKPATACPRKSSSRSGASRPITATSWAATTCSRR